MIELFVTTECESVESPIRQIRPRDIAVVLLGDMAVFLAFVVLGRSEHGSSRAERSSARRCRSPSHGLVISPWLGACRASTLYNAKTAVWRVPLIWVLCGVVGLLARALLTDRPVDTGLCSRSDSRPRGVARLACAVYSRSSPAGSPAHERIPTPLATTDVAGPGSGRSWPPRRPRPRVSAGSVGHAGYDPFGKDCHGADPLVVWLPFMRPRNQGPRSRRCRRAAYGVCRRRRHDYRLSRCCLP